MATERGLQRRIKQHVNAQAHRFYAVVQPGFEKTAQDELATMGIRKSHVDVGGIEFDGKLNDCYRINICSRTISRIIMRLKSFKSVHFQKFRERVQEFPWELYLGENPVGLNISSHHSRLYHTGRLESEIMDGIRKRMESHGIEVSFYSGADTFSNAQVVFARLENDICQMSLDTSGALLYKRGYAENYRKLVLAAPIRETLASLILLESRLPDYDMVIDPMCGSGTFSIEAGMIFSSRFPGMEREFAFERWPAFRRAAYNHLLKKLSEESGTKSVIREKKIICSDIKREAVAAARENIESSGLSDHIEIRNMDFLRETIPLPANRRALLVLNPPYGARLKNSVELMYRNIGRKIRDDYSDCGYAILVPGLEIEKILSLTYNRKVLFMNGGIRVALLIRDAQ